MFDLPPAEFPPIPSTTIVEGLEECGIKADTISIEEGYVPELKRVTITEDNLPSTKFECVWEASWNHEVRFSNAKLQSNYTKFTNQKLLAWQLVSTRRSLEENGLLDGLPNVDDFDTKDEFLNNLAQHCGIKNGSPYYESKPDAWEFDRDFIENAALNQNGQRQLTCFFGGLTIQKSTDPKMAIPFGFPGNEVSEHESND